jgi:hypothetical protein
MNTDKPGNDVSREVERRREILIAGSYDASFPMEPTERKRIQELLERWQTPNRPATVPELMKQFCVSAFSYAPLRNNFLKPLIRGIPMRDTIARALSAGFDNKEFLNDAKWFPEPLGELARRIQAFNNFDLSSRQFKPRIVAVMVTGSAKLKQELSGGLEAFYKKIADVTDPLDMWRLVNDFSITIDQVGPALICDFFKEMGFTGYVKVDHHFKTQFSRLVFSEASCRNSPQKSFILSQKIAKDIGMTPFHLDSIMYLWGRYGSRLSRLAGRT